MSFDTVAYLVLGLAFAAVLGFLLYLRPPGWRVFSGIELLFIVLALMNCITLQAARIFLITEAVYLLLATICFGAAMSRRAKTRSPDEVLKSPMATSQFRWLAVAYFAVIARLLLVPFVPFMFR